jgi:hypothetical protein
MANAGDVVEVRSSSGSRLWLCGVGGKMEAVGKGCAGLTRWRSDALPPLGHPLGLPLGLPLEIESSISQRGRQRSVG